MAENKDTKSEDKYTLLLNSITDGCWILDPKWRYKFVNKAGARLVNMSPDQLVGRKLTELFPGVEKTEFFKAYKRSMDNRTKESVSAPFTFPDGRKGFYEVRVYPISEGILCIGREVTKEKEVEERIKESEERFRILFEYAPDGIYLSDLKGNFIDGNKAAEKLTGYKREELIGKNMLKAGLLPANQIPKALKNLAKNAAGRPTGPDYFTLIRKGGDKIEVEIGTYPVKIKGKTLVLGIARDITERKKAEEEVKKSREDYKTIFENLPFVAFTLDRKGRLLEANKYAEQLTGLKLKDLKGKKFSQFGLLGKRDLLKAFIEFRKNLQGKITKKTVYTVKMKDGKEMLLELVGIPIKEGDRVTKVLDVGEDITEREKIRDEIEKSKKFLETLVETAESVIVGLDTKGNIKLVNQAFERLTGYKREEILGKNWFDLFIPVEIREEIKRVFEGVKEGEPTAKHHENPILTKSGEERVILWSNNIITNEEGKSEMVISVGNDITERKRMEEELRKRTEESERFTRLAVGRELKMIELKKRIRELEEKLKKHGIEHEKK